MPDLDDIKNTAVDVAGRAKEVAGRVTGDESLEDDGEIQRAAVTARKNGEDEQDLFG